MLMRYWKTKSSREGLQVFMREEIVPAAGIGLITLIENTQLIEKSRRSKRTIP
jgi:hypothetical protein